MDIVKRDIIVSNLSMSIVSLLQSVGSSLADGQIDWSERAGISGQAILFGTLIESSSRGLSTEDWGEVVSELSRKLSV